MGQHKHNPVAITFAKGEVIRSDRKPIPQTPSHTERVITAGDAYKWKRTFGRHRGKRIISGNCLVRAIPKVRGKANVKRAKRARMASLKSAA